MVRRLTVFAHYGVTSRVADHVLFHVRALRPHCDTLLFVSNSPLSTESSVALGEVCDGIVERDNTGFDFAAWRDVLTSQDMRAWDEVLLTNSSVIGPLFGLAPMFSEMQERKCDFWGLTTNKKFRPHIQSYFICFRSDVINSGAWHEFWRSVGNVTSKRRVILEYETQLTQLLEHAGFSSDVYISPFQVKGIKRFFVRRTNHLLPLYVISDLNYVDPTIHAPVELIRKGFPYIKASLLWGRAKRQPFSIKDVMNLGGVDYDWSLIGR